MRGLAAFRDRAGVLRLAGIVAGGLAIHDALTLRRTEEALVGQRRPVTAIAALTDAAGLPLIANAGSDGTIRLWDPRKGRAVFDPVRLKKACALATAPRPDAIDLVLAGHDDGALTCWDPETKTVSTSPADTGPVVAMAAARLAGGRVLVVVGLMDGSVRARWLCLETTDEPGASASAAGWRPGPVLLGHEGRVNCVVVMPSGRAPTELVSVASGGDDGTVRLWEIEPSAAFADGRNETGAAPRGAREPLAWPREWMLTAPGGRRLAVTADDDGQVIWAGERAGKGRLKLPAGPAHCAVLLTGPGGEQILALADQAGVISSWRLPAGSPFGPPLHGHTDWVRALAVLTPEDGPQILVSGGDDATVRFWRLDQAAALHVVPLDAPIVSLSVLGRDVQVGLTSGMVTIRLETGQMLVEKERTEHVR
jgi:WD40 repeat protein